MLKRRLVGVVLVRRGIAVQGVRFERYLPLGQPEIAISYLDCWGIDEILVLHIDACEMDLATGGRVQSYTRHCQVPLAVGGGVECVDDVKRIIKAGADKVVINSALVSNSHVITQAAALFGSQAVIASIDVRLESDQFYRAYIESGHKATAIGPIELARRAVELGAGEILITAIDRDGSGTGYDLRLVSSVVNAVQVPVIACGGAGRPAHLKQALDCGASAVAAANMWHFSEHSVIVAKRALVNNGAPVRLDTYADYEAITVLEDGRIAKQSDDALEALRFQYIPEDVI